jgi:antitoxin HicB
MFKYPASASYDEESDTYEISFRDFKTAHSVAYDEEDIELEASEGLTAAIGDSISSRLLIPEASPALPGEILVHIPVLTCLKAALHNAMMQTDTRKADLARKLNMNSQQIDRLLDVEHASKIDALEQALYLLGHEVTVSIKAV